jgi:hypothetical protein
MVSSNLIYQVKVPRNMENYFKLVFIIRQYYDFNQEAAKLQ